MVDVTFENLYPIAGLIIISVTIWGMARKFTSMELTIQNHRKDIEKLQEQLAEFKRDLRELLLWKAKTENHKYK